MEVNSKAEAATAIALYLSREEGYVTVESIAYAVEYSMSYIEVIVKQLRESLVLGAARGRSGGYYLARLPEHITLLQIYDAIDQRESSRLTWKDPLIRAGMARHTELMRRHLEATTLADLLESNERL